jgi:hypothetical protein
MALAAFTLSNLSNSVAETLSAALLANGYLIYWKPLDALQTPDGLYLEYQVNQAGILQSDPTVANRLAVSKGIITLRDDDFSFPEHPTRPTSDGAVVSPENISVPTIALQVEHDGNGGLLGLGSRERARFVSVILYGLARDRGEQMFLTDMLRREFDESQFIDVRDHDAGTRAAVGKVEIYGSEVGMLIYPLGAESRAFEFTLNARLRYEA